MLLRRKGQLVLQLHLLPRLLHIVMLLLMAVAVAAAGAVVW